MRGPRRSSEGRSGDRKPYAAFDVETDGLRGGLTYWTAACECEPGRVYTGTDVGALWDTILRGGGPGHGTQGGWSRSHRARDHVWWAHNGGEYDYVYLQGPIVADALAGRLTAVPVVRADQTIGWRIDAAKHRTDLRDSFALLPASLASLTAQLAPDLPKGDIGLSRGVTFDPSRADHRAYAERDTVALLAVLGRFRAILADAFDGALPSWSAASTALRAWGRLLADDESFVPPSESAAGLARAGYYGGLVHLSDVGWHDDVVTVDANSMYPTVMRAAGVPDGWHWTTRTYDPDRPGVYVVRVMVPESTPFTFLPYRDPAGQLAWPLGRFPTVLWSNEIAAARARGIGVEVVSGVVWQRLAYPFGAFVDRVEAMRRDGGAMGTVGKLMGNSLYGKFGSKSTRTDWVVSAERPGPDWWPPADASVEGLWQRLDVPLRAPYLMPHWSAWVTASARLSLLSIVEAVGADAVLYTDTDSVTAPRAAVEAAIAAGRLSVGPAFGQVKVERRWSRFRALAPKVVEGVDADTGEPIYKAKGIPRRLVAAAFDTGEVGWESPNAAIRVLQGSPMLTSRTRSLSDISGSVAWRLAGDGVRVRPVRLGESGA